MYNYSEIAVVYNAINRIQHFITRQDKLVGAPKYYSYHVYVAIDISCLYAYHGAIGAFMKVYPNKVV